MDTRQLQLIDPGPAGVSVRMLDRRVLVAEAARPDSVRFLKHVARRLGICYSTFVRWRHLDPGLADVLRVVRERRERARSGRKK